MNEIIRLYGKPFRKPSDEPRVNRPPRHSFSARRVASALLPTLAIAAGVGLFCWKGDWCFSVDTRAGWGDPEAQYTIGKRDFVLAGSPLERRQAVDCIRRAADQGHAKAQTALGMIYSRNLGIPQDGVLAVKWLLKAAVQNEPAAQTELAGIYARGRGVEQNVRKAIYWYSQAAGNGSRIANANLALSKAANRAPLAEVTTAAGTRYIKVSLRRIDSDGITVAYESANGGVGLAKLKKDDLPDGLKQLCQYTAQTNAAGATVPWL